MELFILCFELVGTVAFALSGAMKSFLKEMDIFGSCILALTTAVGGGIIRDLILGLTPPAAFIDPTNALIAIGVAIVAFIPAIRKHLTKNTRTYERILLIADSAGAAKIRLQEIQQELAQEELRLVRTRQEVETQIQAEQQRLVVAQEELRSFIQTVQSVCQGQLALLDRLPTLPAEGVDAAWYCTYESEVAK